MITSFLIGFRDRFSFLLRSLHTCPCNLKHWVFGRGLEIAYIDLGQDLLFMEKPFLLSFTQFTCFLSLKIRHRAISIFDSEAKTLDLRSMLVQIPSWINIDNSMISKQLLRLWFDNGWHYFVYLLVKKSLLAVDYDNRQERFLIDLLALILYLRLAWSLILFLFLLWLTLWPSNHRLSDNRG
jgi:hypothetical protein